MRRSPSDAEQLLWQSLRNRQLEGLKFRRQHKLPPYIADFVCTEQMLVVEVDGEQHGDAADYDLQRDAFLNDAGWRVIRFSAADVVRDVDAVLATILRECRPSPSP